MATPIQHDRLEDAFGHGIIGGLIGGALMGLLLVIVFPTFNIGGFWQPLNLIAAVFHQDWGVLMNFSVLPTLIGAMIHVTMSALLGGLFGLAANRLNTDSVALVAVIAGLIVWALAQFIALPIIDPIMAARTPLWLLALGHALYGIGLGGYLAWHWSPLPAR